MSGSEYESQPVAAEADIESVNESQETRRFDSDQISGVPRPGLVLRGRYRLDSELGRGAMGMVFRATDLELLRPVAVKILAERLGARGTGEKGKGETGKEGQGEDAGRTSAVSVRAGAVPDSRASTDDMRSRFMREARAAAALNHPNIVAVYDGGEDHAFPFFVMELVEG